MKILIAVDGSPAALAATRYIGRLASRLDGRTLVLLYVRPVHTGGVVGLGTAGPLQEARLEQELGAVEREVLDEASELLQAIGLAAEQIVETGVAGPTICRVAAEGGYELVVLGSRGHGELKSLLVGSTSAAVIHGAPCPVLVVK